MSFYIILFYTIYFFQEYMKLSPPALTVWIIQILYNTSIHVFHTHFLNQWFPCLQKPLGEVGGTALSRTRCWTPIGPTDANVRMTLIWNFSGEASVVVNVCNPVLRCSFVGAVGNLKLVSYSRLKMSFSRAPLKRFNENVGKWRTITSSMLANYPL